MVFAGPDSASRLVLRLRGAVVLMSILVVAWLIVGLRLYFFPPHTGPAAWVCVLHAVGAGINALLLAFLAVWVWRAASWATVTAALTLVVNGLLIVQPAMTTGYGLVLLLTVTAGVLAGSLVVRPQRPPVF